MCCSFLASPLDCVGDFWDDDCSLLIQAPAQKGNENSASSRFIPSNPQPNIDSVAGYGVRLLSFPLRRFVVIGQIYGAASFFALLLVEALVCFHPLRFVFARHNSSLSDGLFCNHFGFNVVCWFYVFFGDLNRVLLYYNWGFSFFFNRILLDFFYQFYWYFLLCLRF